MEQIYKVYRNLLGVVATEAPIMSVFTILAPVGYGLLQPINVYVNSMIFNLGLAIAREGYLWNDYLLWLVAFVATNSRDRHLLQLDGIYARLFQATWYERQGTRGVKKHGKKGYNRYNCTVVISVSGLIVCYVNQEPCIIFWPIFCEE